MNDVVVMESGTDSVTGHRAMTRHCVGVELASRDPKALARFYESALGFSYFHETKNRIEMKLGDCVLRLRKAHGRLMPSGSRSHDRWFRHLAVVVRDMGRACAHVAQFSPLPVSAHPEMLPAWNEASGGIEAFYPA